MPDEIQQPSTSDAVQSEINVSTMPDQLPTEDVKGLKSAYQKVVEERNQLKAIATKMQQLEAIVGTLAPDELKKLKEAENQRQELESRMAQMTSQIESNLKTTYEQQLNQVREETKREKDARIKLEKRNEIVSLFAKFNGKGEELENFLALAAETFEYDPEQKAIARILDKGKPVFDDGQPISPDKWMETLRAKGGAYSACFDATNKSSGGGFVTGVSSAGGTQIYPASKMNEVYASDPDAPRKVRQGLIKFDHSR